MTESFTRKWLLTALVLTIGACSNLGGQEPQNASQMAQLTQSVDQCLASQDDGHRQRAQQQQQLAQQQRQLEEVLAALATIRQEQADAREAPPASLPAPAPTCPPPPAPAEFTKLIVGQKEHIWVQDLQLALPARIDTGAETASLDARNIELFERNSKNWVRFEIMHPETEETLQLERPLERMALILQASSREPERRPVIKLGIAIGHITQSAEFTLSDRSHLDHQMLEGRNILKDVMIVDVSRENIAPPTQLQADTINP